MSNVSTKKVFIQIETPAEQQEHLKMQRKTFKLLQPGVATDKENLAGRPQVDKLGRLKAASDVTLSSAEFAKRKKIDTRIAETQTSPEKKSVTVEDLTSQSEPSENYWECLAEKRRLALEKSLEENQGLYERIDSLEEELNTSRQLLEEARNLVEVLSEMLHETEKTNEQTEDEEGLSSLAENNLPEDDSDSKSED